MDERVNRVAALANAAAYDEKAAAEYVDGAPHVKHAGLRKLYAELVVKVYDKAKESTATPLVLDLGAGEGSATLPFLELGAKVVAIDISASQLDALKARCSNFGDRLEIRCQDIQEAFKDKAPVYNIIVMNSFLHHIPDYLGLIADAAALLKPGGQFFFFQDPMRYDTLTVPTSLFAKAAYFSWRLFKGDVIGGLKRRFRRARGVYEENVYDNAEYHVTRNGVDQEDICRLLGAQGFTCNIRKYFSTQMIGFQTLGTSLGLENTFAVLAEKRN